MIAMAACREELLGQLQRLGCVEIREPETAGEDWSGLLERESSRLAEAKGALAEVNTALAAMRRYGQVKDGLFVKRRLVTEKEFLGGGLEAQAKTVTQDVGERLRTLSGIQTEMSRLQARRAGLLPWQFKADFVIRSNFLNQLRLKYLQPAAQPADNPAAHRIRSPLVQAVRYFGRVG